MGRHQIFRDGQWVDLERDSELFKKMEQFDKAVIISFGQVVQFKLDGVLQVGKVTGADKAGNITLAKVCNVTKAGYQFSSTDTVKIKKEAIIKQIN